MAKATQDPQRPQGDRWLVRFKYKGRAFKYTCKPQGRKSAKQVATEAALRVDQRLGMLREGHLAMPSDIAYENVGRWIYNDSAVTAPAPQQEQNGGTIDQLVKDYLKMRYQKVLIREQGIREGGLSRGSYSSDYYRLQDFLKYCRNQNKAKLSSIVTADFLGAYRTKLLDVVAKNRERTVDIKHHLRTVKALLNWALDEERLESLPRNVLRRDFAKIGIDPPKPEHYSLEEIRCLFAKANGRMRLFILLGLNAGYLQSDIASLTHDMVDFETGIIKRDRQKTGVESEHKLWPLTLKLLKQYATDPTEHPDTLLLNSHGRVLYSETRKDDGRVTKKDTIGNSFKRLANDVGVKLTFKHFRKTGANLIKEKFQEYPHLPYMYCSHDNEGIQKSYTGHFADLLHKATDWLGEYLDLSDGESKSSLTGSSSQ